MSYKSSTIRYIIITWSLSPWAD